MNKPKPLQLNPIGYSVEQVMQLLPLGRTSIYKLIKFGELQTVVICGRRIVPASEISRLLAPPESNTSQVKALIAS
jgi:hypothetical protein